MATQLDTSLSQPQCREFAMNQNNQKTRSRSETSFLDTCISLTPSPSRNTATQDLADFLKASSPEDYKRYLSSSAEDLSTSTVTWGGSFRFLRSTPVAPTVKRNATHPKASLPSRNVVSRTTSKGKPYLQIRVDYGGTCFASRRTAEISQQTSSSSETSSGMYRSSIVTSTSTSAEPGISPRALCPGERSLSPPRNAQESKTSLDIATMGRYQEFLDSGSDTKTLSNSIGAVSNSYTSDIVSAGMAELRAYQERERMKPPPRSPGEPSTPYSPSGVESTKGSLRRHSRSNSTKIVRPVSQAISTRSSVVSDIFDDVTDTEFEGTAGTGPQRKKSRKAPPRPGPPPNRSLPSLPESQSDLRPELGDKRPVLASNSRVLPTAESIRSDRKTREERVKARKAKDIKQHKQLMREKSIVRQNRNSSISGISSAGSDSGKVDKLSTRRSTSKQNTSNDDISKRSSITVLSEQPALSISSLPSNPPPGKRTHAHSTKDPGSPGALGDDKLQFPASPTLSSSVRNSSVKEIELEARMLAVERKSRMLEQALMAVIRSTVGGQAQRGAELFKANDMEELLNGLDLEELPVAFAAGG